MKRWIALAAAAALSAPGPAFAQSIRAVAPPVTPVAMQGLPAAVEPLTLETGVESVTPLALETLSPVTAVPAVQRDARRIGAVERASVARATARSRRQPTRERSLSAVGDELSGRFDRTRASKPAVDAVDAPALEPSTLATVPASSAKKRGALVGLLSGFVPTLAQAMPDGYDGHVPTYQDYVQRQLQTPAAASDGTTGFIIMLVVAVAAVVGIVWYLIRKDNLKQKKVDEMMKEAQEFEQQNPYRGPLAHAGGRGSSSVGRQGKGQAENVPPEKPVMFNDIAGQDEAKAELSRVVKFLKDPEPFFKLHAKGFKGVLLFGPPGTGKTLIARAVANEAGVPFLYKSGSDFVNTYVGVGAKNVREMFAEARKAANGGTAILFIDEIDGLAKRRDSGGDGNSEYDQTITQLLTELDGFDKDRLIVIAATNRVEALDPALVRGKRFGLKVPVGLPDIEGREQVFRVHTREMEADKVLGGDIDYRRLAAATPGLAGADIAEIVNDAAMMAGEAGKAKVSMEEFQAAVDRYSLGHKRRLVMSAKEKRVLAFHEGGHALVSHLLPNADPVRTVTVIPHGLNALGLMQAVPEEERVLQSRSWLVDRMAVALGGRAGEELATDGEKFSGASNDIESASRIARYMVMKFGMSEKVGMVSYDFEGERAAGKALSAETQKLIDDEVKSLLDDAYKRAREVLTQHRGQLEKLAAALIERETLRGSELEAIIAPSSPDAGASEAPPAP